MTDFELNKAIAELLVGHTFNGTVHIFKGDNQVNYVENWNDLMPLVVEHMFKINISRNRVTAEDSIIGESFDKEFYQWGIDEPECGLDKKQHITKRALAECLLKVLENAQ